MKRHLWFLALVLSLTVAPAAEAASSEVARFAIVVGSNRPERPTDGKLRYADDDAVATHELLIQAGVESQLLVAPDNDTRSFRDIGPHQSPGVRQLDAAFSSVSSKIRSAAKAGRKTEFLFFFSGHGNVDHGEGYVVLEDGRLTRTKLYSMLAQSPAGRNHVFVDACKSYYFVFGKGPHVAVREPASTQEALEQDVPGELYNTGFVLSTSSDRESHEWENYQAGILSHELRSALRGAADVDGNGSVSYHELAAFLVTANRGIKNPQFRPDFTVIPPQRDYDGEVLNWGVVPAAVRLLGSRLGHVYVMTEIGERVLDVYPDDQQALALHLPPKRPLFLRRDETDGSSEYELTSLEPVQVASLDVRREAVGRRGPVDEAFKKLFTAPFGRKSLLDIREFELEQLKPPVPDNPVRPPSRTRETLGTAAGILALGAAAGGLTTGLLSAERHYGGADGSQSEIDSRNRSGHDLKIASIVLFAVAGAAGLTWGWTKLASDSSISIEPVAKYERKEQGASLTIVRRF